MPPSLGKIGERFETAWSSIIRGVDAMRVVSVNVGLARTVRWRGRDVTTGIFKEPVEDRVPVRRLNLDGDRQADLSVHGGPAKAVYAYPLEHYGFWRDQLAQELPFGAFGENLTVAGPPLEDEVAVGDRFRVGTAELVVTQPRIPCYKLGLRLGRNDMVKRLLASGRTGYYLAVAAEGVSRPGGAGPVLDAQAKHAYRRRFAELDEELEARAWQDGERAACVREEIDFLASELAAAFGFGGRDRETASPAERARISVTKAIKTAIRMIERESPELASHLASSIRTGRFCRYAPPAAAPPRWQLAHDRSARLHASHSSARRRTS
jgi:MOSC domain-containing protein YiiM